MRMFTVFIYLTMESIERYFKRFNLHFSKTAGNFLTTVRQQSVTDRNFLYGVRCEVFSGCYGEESCLMGYQNLVLHGVVYHKMEILIRKNVQLSILETHVH